MRTASPPAVAFAVFLSSGGVFGQKASFEDEEKLIGLQNTWAEARVKGDVAFLERLYAKEFTVTNMGGSGSSSEFDIDIFVSGDMGSEIVRGGEMKVAVYGNVAMVTGLQYVKGKYKNNPGEFLLRFTNVYIRRDGRRRLIKHHSTEVRGNKQA